MKKRAYTFPIFFFISLVLFAQGDDWNDRTIYTCDCIKGEEVARNSLIFEVGFDTDGCTEFTGYIDPDLPLNGGEFDPDGIINMNYVRIYQPLRDNATDIIQDHGVIDYNQWSEVITYYDGLGKEIQKVDVKASSYGNDIIQPIIYDDFGRIQKEYLPYAIAQAVETIGGYRQDPTTELQTFYSNYFNVADANVSFSNKKFDGSPTNRVLKQGSPGNAWKLLDEGGNNVEFQLSSNEIDIPFFKIINGNLVRDEEDYQIRTLYKSTIIDENDKGTVEYKNKQGQVILNYRQYFDDDDNLVLTKTYYVYDDFGLLRYVIPPLASIALENLIGTIGNYVSDQTIDELCYYYEYDAKKRMILKKLPGAHPIYMVY